MLTFLKRRGSCEHHEDSVRFVNILIISMQITISIFTLFALIVSIGQEGQEGS